MIVLSAWLLNDNPCSRPQSANLKNSFKLIPAAAEKWDAITLPPWVEKISDVVSVRFSTLFSSLKDMWCGIMKTSTDSLVHQNICGVV